MMFAGKYSPTTGLEIQMTDAFYAYSGLLNASAMVLLLAIIVAFYVSLTLEAFKNATETRVEATALRRGGAGMDYRPGV
jgi:hypothetical protein